MSQLTRYYHLLRQLDILRSRVALGDHGNFVNLRPRFSGRNYNQSGRNPEDLFAREGDDSTKHRKCLIIWQELYHVSGGRVAPSIGAGGPTAISSNRTQDFPEETTTNLEEIRKKFA